MAIVPSRGGPLVFGPAKPTGPLKKPKVTVDTLLVSKRMEKLIPSVQKQFEIALTNFAPKVVDSVRAETPVMTGDLQSTVRHDKVKTTKTTVLVSIRAGGIRGPVRKKTVTYGATVHQLGSPRGRGRFFVINPVMAMSESWLPKIARAAVDRAVKDVT